MTKLCKCGCRQVVRQGNKFVLGHNWRGQKHSKASIAIMSQSKMGHLVTSHTIRMVRLAHIGRVQPESERLKKSLANDRGVWSRWHPFVYYALFHNVLRPAVLKRDGYECVRCGVKPRDRTQLHAHHVVPVKVGYRSLLCDALSNLVTLCISCHMKLEHWRYPSRWRAFLFFAKTYLSKFHYSEQLLNRYIGQRKTILELERYNAD